MYANYGGDGTFAASQSIPVNLIVTPEPSTITVTVIDTTPGIPNRNQPVTKVPYGEILDVQVQVAGQSGHGVATGNVVLDANGQPLYGGSFPLNSSGYADAVTTSLGVANSPYSFTASYAGDASFQKSPPSAPSSLTIVKAPTTASIAPNANPVSDATTETFTVIIGTTGYGFAAPSGVVTITGSNGTVLGSATLTGVTGGGQHDSSFANITIPAQSITTGNTVTVSYPGDANYLGSTGATGPITVTVSGLPPTTTTLTVNPTTVAPTGNITLTAAVTSTVLNFTGNVTFFIDGIPVPITPAGQPAPTYAVSAAGAVAPLTIPVTGFAPGQHTASAVFSGDSTHKASISAGVPFIITAATGTTPSTTTITLNPPAPTTRGAGNRHHRDRAGDAGRSTRPHGNRPDHDRRQHRRHPDAAERNRLRPATRCPPASSPSEPTRPRSSTRAIPSTPRPTRPWSPSPSRRRATPPPRSSSRTSRPRSGRASPSPSPRRSRPARLSPPAPPR